MRFLLYANVFIPKPSLVIVSMRQDIVDTDRLAHVILLDGQAVVLTSCKHGDA